MKKLISKGCISYDLIYIIVREDICTPNWHQHPVFMCFWDAEKMISTLVDKEEMCLLYLRGEIYRIFMARRV